MSQQNQNNEHKIIDWKQKSGSDSNRINKRAKKRKPTNCTTTTANPIRPPRAVGQPLRRLHQKIKEIYDEEDENETSPVFNIQLIEDIEEEKQQKTSMETFRITKQMELAGKLNLIMNTALVAEKAGLKPEMTAEDSKLANSAEYDLKKIRRQTLKSKVEKPLKLKGELPEQEISTAVKGIKKAKDNLPPDSLENFTAENTAELASLDEEDMAKLILHKSGRKSPKKSLSEIAKGLNSLNNIESDENNNR